MPLRLNANEPAAIETAAQRLGAGSLVGMPTETVYGLAADAGNASAVQRIFAAKGRPAEHPLIVHIAGPGACRTLGVDSEKRPQRGQFLPDLQTNSPAIGQKDGENEVSACEKWTAAVDLQPTLPKSDRLLEATDAAGWRAAVAPFARTVPDFAAALMVAFWPGPLTLILPRREGVAALAAGGQDTVGLRCPAHPVAQALLAAARAHGVQGVAAPSANRFGRISPTTAQHVAEEFAHLSASALLILDAGACAIGIESTIVDCSRSQPVLLRPGVITPAQLQAVCAQPVRERDARAPRAPGTLASHYAPSAQVRLLEGWALQSALDLLGPAARHVAVYARAPLRAAPSVLLRRMPEDAAQAAQELFATLRDLDASGVRLIWVETPPTGAQWDGVRDRLQRAAA